MIVRLAGSVINLCLAVSFCLAANLCLAVTYAGNDQRTGWPFLLRVGDMNHLIAAIKRYRQFRMTVMNDIHKTTGNVLE